MKSDRGIFKRSDSPNYWIRFADENGKMIVMSTSTVSKKLAREIRDKKKTMVAENRHMDIKKTPTTPFFDLCNEYWEQWGQNMRTKGLLKIKKDGTRLGMIEIWKKGFGNVSVRDIDQRTVERFLTRHTQKTEDREALTSGTRNRHLAMLRAMFNKGVKWGLVAENPCEGVSKLREAPPRDRFLTPEEVEALLSAACDSLLPIIKIALHTGMRHGEMLNLEWRDVDFVNRLVKVRESKSGKSRSIPMDQTLFDVLGELPSRSEKAFVLTQRTHVNQSFRRALAKAKIANFRFHDLRHTFASHLAMKGVPMKTIQEYLGHANLTMTMKYSHLAPSHHRDAIQILDTAYTPSPSASSTKTRTVNQVSL